MSDSFGYRSVSFTGSIIIFIELVVTFLSFYTVLQYGPIIFLSIPFEQKMIPSIITSIWLIVFFLMVAHLSRIIAYLKDPIKQVLRIAKPLPKENVPNSVASELEKNMGNWSVQLLVSDKLDEALAVEDLKSAGKALVVLPKTMIEVFDRDQLSTIMLHELYHIYSSRVRPAMGVHAFENAFIGRTKWPQAMIVAIVLSLFLDYAFHLLFPQPAKVSGEIVSILLFYVYILKIFGYFFSVLIIGGIVFLLYIILRGFRDPNAISPQFSYVDELFADAYSILKSEKPEKFRSALVMAELIKLGVLTQDKTRIDFGVSEKMQSFNLNITLKEIFQAKAFNKKGELKNILRFLFDFFLRGRFTRFGTRPPHRFLLSRKLERLLNDRMSSNIRRDSASGHFEKKLLPQLQQFMKKKKPEAFHAFTSYLKLHNRDFNLVQCSKDLSIDIFDAFLMLLATIELDIVEFDPVF